MVVGMTLSATSTSVAICCGGVTYVSTPFAQMLAIIADRIVLNTIGTVLYRISFNLVNRNVVGV